MTHQHNSNGREWLMVKVPSEATRISGPIMSEPRIQLFITCQTPSGNKTIYLPEECAFNRYSIHSDSLTITEEQAAEIVDKDEAGWYKGYEQSGDYQVISSTSAVKSYRSLLRSLNINSRVINLVRI
jgi:hypothetical protein